MITVAHRLHTVIDSDLVVVMDAGQVVEHGPPHELLNPELAQRDLTGMEPYAVGQERITGSGRLAHLIRQTGREESARLAQVARAAYVRSHRRTDAGL